MNQTPTSLVQQGLPGFLFTIDHIGTAYLPPHGAPLRTLPKYRIFYEQIIVLMLILALSY